MLQLTSSEVTVKTITVSLFKKIKERHGWQAKNIINKNFR